MFLSNVLRYQVERGDAVAAASLEQISPVAWQHLNFHGRYEFTKSIRPIDLEAIVQELAPQRDYEDFVEKQMCDISILVRHIIFS